MAMSPTRTGRRRDTPPPSTGPDEKDVLLRFLDYLRESAAAKVQGAACTDLTAPVPRPPGRKKAPTMRWALVHMIEETGRHAGHLDILRELVDGGTGR
jgi:hypothetical protein